MKEYRRLSRAVIRDRRWPALRLQALRRDGWRCVQCGAKRGLEVDHVEAVRNAPGKAFDLANLQVLCGSCHSGKTRVEMGFKPADPERLKWRALLAGR